MKIVQINAVYGIGSTGRIVQDISAALTAQGHSAYVFWASQCKKDVNAQFIRVGNTLDHKLHALLRRLDGKQGWHSKGATQKLCRQLLEIEPDVVHLHNLHSNYIHLPTLLTFLGEENIPTLITLHDCWMFTAGACMHYHSCCQWEQGCNNCPLSKPGQKETAKMYRVKKELYTQMQNLYINGVSKWTTDVAKQSMLKSARDNRCIYNWVDTDIFKPQENTEAIREKYGIPAHHKLILGVSQGWSEEKGLKEFELIAEKLADQATVLLVGQGKNIPAMPNLRCIGFTNNRQELVELYSAADVLVNPSKAETFGLVTAEAMACGTPIVAYNNTGSAELVVPQCGVLVPDGDVTALLEGIKTVVGQGKSCYAAACVTHVRENFQKEKQLQKYMDFYLQMASDK